MGNASGVGIKRSVVHFGLTRSARLNVQCNDHELDKLNDTPATVLKFRTFNPLCDFLFPFVSPSCNVGRTLCCMYVLIYLSFVYLHLCLTQFGLRDCHGSITELFSG